MIYDDQWSFESFEEDKYGKMMMMDGSWWSFFHWVWMFHNVSHSFSYPFSYPRSKARPWSMVWWHECKCSQHEQFWDTCLLKDSVAVLVAVRPFCAMKGRIFTSLRDLGELRASAKCLFRFCMGQNWVQMDPPMYGRFEDFGPNFGGPMILAHAPCMFFNSDDSSDPAG